MSIINAYTLKIKVATIGNSFQMYLMNNVCKKTKVLLIFLAMYTLANVVGFFTGRLLNTVQLCQSVASLVIVGGCHVISRVTENSVWMKLMPFLFMLNHAVFSNCILLSAFSEQGVREGQEQFGDDYPLKLEQLVFT